MTNGASSSIKHKGLHSRNVHNVGYDFPSLIKDSPDFEQYVRPNHYGDLSIDFSDPMAVKALNKALLKQFYHIDYWDIPEGFLCPPIPGRVDYIHHVADLLSVEGKVPKGHKVKALDIGTGANAIYPLLGIQTYGWQFTASDIDILAIDNVVKIINKNTIIKGKLALRLQDKPDNIFQSVIQPNDRFNVTLCNPPFHASLAEANAGNERKVKNLAINRSKKNHSDVVKASETSQVALNFGGQNAELWCEGGERQFLQRMINESKNFSQQCQWFTSLISKKDNLISCHKILKDVKAQQIKVIEMKQGNKQTRILCWSFLNKKQADLWLDFHA
ncbi:23S rRNA (adenine(1618)-N(6))-methyltransferase RlmF [Shewanella surugensis]|uniref:Ribosomal RNA large subunit methyltransferase F n=1 Tax=Shewanella surugensis TaxID=212020 RepID=A0ABT0L8K9_9GAMM|nr:23S rRNA (adenine(1618)-N(6))-methyltransferase RlmF [Shewanella surugensis]MCL1124034.1 23S rRNA (adenine(1618)-N(6))-methyltransferase RlmF [Shewanella surugensis]